MTADEFAEWRPRSIESFASELAQAMNRPFDAERLVRSAGVNELGLSVFGFNDSAKALYDSIGYRVLAMQMSKSL